MKMFCYVEEGSVISETKPMRCSEVSIQADAMTLRKIAEFILECADKMAEIKPDGSSHFHLQDEWSEWKPEFPDLIVISPPERP